MKALFICIQGDESVYENIGNKDIGCCFTTVLILCSELGYHNFSKFCLYSALILESPITTIINIHKYQNFTNLSLYVIIFKDIIFLPRSI